MLTRNYTTLDYVYYTSAGKPGPRFNLWAEIPPEERSSWIASAPVTRRGTQSTFSPYLDDQVAIHLFVIRAHRLKSGERYIAAAMKELRGDQIGNLEYWLDRVYDPNALAKRMKGKAPMAVVLLVFAILSGIYVFLLRGAVRKRSLAPI